MGKRIPTKKLQKRQVVRSVVRPELVITVRRVHHYDGADSVIMAYSGNRGKFITSHPDEYWTFV